MIGVDELTTNKVRTQQYFVFNETSYDTKGKFTHN